VNANGKGNGKARAPIRAGVLRALILAGLLPVVLTFVANQTLTRQALLDSEYDKMSVLAYEVVRQIEEVMTTAAGSLAALASNPQLVASLVAEDAESQDLRIMRDFPAVFSEMALYDTAGVQQAATAYGPIADVADAAGFRRALAGQAAFSIPHLVLGRPELYITAFCPVRDGRGQIRHVVGARLPMEKIAQILRAVRIGQQGFLVLLDDRGNVLAHPDAGRTLEKFDEQTPMYFWKHHSRGIYPPGQAEPFAFVSAVIGPEQTRTGQPWVLLALKPYAEVLALPREEMRLHLAVALLTIAVVTLVGLVLSRRLSRPIMNLAAAAQRVAHGNLDANVPENGPREIHQLGVAFNQMVRELRQHHERLESVVQQRTLKLRDSQRRQEQLPAHLRAAYESIVDGILILEWPSGKVIAANQHFADLFGLAPAELQGRNAAEVSAAIREHFVEPRDNALRWDHYQRLSEEVGLEEWELTRPAHRTLSVYSGPVAGAAGQIFARLWMFRDLSKQRLLEAELLQAQKMEAIGRLAGGIAHDFNNLLTGILGNLTMAEMELKPGGDPGNFIRLARQASKRAGELVTQLLGFSRRGRLNLGRCDLNAIVHEVHGLLQHTVDPRVRLVAEPQERLWSTTADATQLQQVLMNLCVNAVDAMPDGGQLTLSTRNVHLEEEQSRQWSDGRPGDFVCLSVADQGHGMSQEVQSRMFEPFFTTKAPGKGTGLGLAMTYGIVKQHGGWIVCESAIGQGTTFHIYLPRTGDAAVATAPADAPAPVTGGRERILVVDDEPAVRGVILIVMQKLGYEVLAAADGEEAVQIFGQRCFEIDLVILDLTMPKLSGRDTFRKLREIRKDIRIIVSSGYPVDVPAFEQEVGSPLDGVVPKPFEVTELASAARSALDRQPKAPEPEPDGARASCPL